MTSSKANAGEPGEAPATAPEVAPGTTPEKTEPARGAGRLSPWLAVATIVLYAAGYPLGSAAVGSMSSSLVVLIRFIASAAILWAIVAIRRPVLPRGRQWLHIAVAGVLTQGVQFLALYWALGHGVASGLASLIIALNPVVTAGLLMALTRTKETRLGTLALVLAAAAVVLACAPEIVADHSLGFSLVAVGVAMLGLSVGGIYQGRFVVGADALVITAVGITASIPPAAVMSVFDHRVDDAPHALAVIAVMVVVSSVGATTLYAACIRAAGARAASVLFAVIPAAASVMSWIALGEQISPWAIAGLVLGAGACVVQTRAGRAEGRTQGRTQGRT